MPAPARASPARHESDSATGDLPTAQALTGCGWRAGRGWEHPRPTLGGAGKGAGPQPAARRAREGGAQLDRVGRESPACGGAVTQGSPGQGGDRTSCRCIPPYPAPHLPLETAAVPLFRADPCRVEGLPSHPASPSEANSKPSRGHNPLPSGLPPHLWLAGPGPPPSAGLASSSNLAVLPGTKPPELEALEAGRVDESLFLQSPREAGRRSRPPTPEPRCPRGLPGPQQLKLRPTSRNRRRFPRASQANPSNLPARLDFSCLSLQGPGKIKGTRKVGKITQDKEQGVWREMESGRGLTGSVRPQQPA